MAWHHFVSYLAIALVLNQRLKPLDRPSSCTLKRHGPSLTIPRAITFCCFTATGKPQLSWAFCLGLRLRNHPGTSRIA